MYISTEVEFKLQEYQMPSEMTPNPAWVLCSSPT